MKMLKVNIRRYIYLGLFLLSMVSLGFCAETNKPGIKLRISVTNPSNETQTFPVKSYLPKGIKDDDVVEKGNFKVGYDFEKSLYYASQSVTLKPQETASLELRIKDIWVISDSEMKALEAHVKELLDMLANSEYKNAGENIKVKILEELESIKESQANTDMSVESRMASFQDNLNRLTEIKRSTARLERIAIQAGASPEVAITDSSLLGSDINTIGPESGTDLKSSPGQGEGKTKGRPSGNKPKGFNLLNKSSFRSGAPNFTTTWKIIYIIIGFLAFLSIIFVGFQLQQHRPLMFDKLTGAFTRAYITERFQGELIIAKKRHTKCSLCMMDIDKFKLINDTYGHACGDATLKEFIITIRQGLRASDLIGRIGGDEFLIVLPTADKPKAIEIAEKVRKLVEGYKVKTQGKEFNISTSIGVVTYPEDGLISSEILRRVDAAMYRAKIKGGNSVTTYD